MKVLMVNKFYYIKGGSETYYFNLKKRLMESGHQVVDFSMKDDRNFESPYSECFVENVDYNRETTFSSKIRMAVNIIYSKEAKDKFEALVLKEKPDIVHLHLFQHQISPSILDICRKYNIPTVYTAHDLKMICPNYKMMHHGKICEECKGGHFYHCAVNKCVKDSYAKSIVSMAEGYIHRWRKSYDTIDYVITPSSFYKEKFTESGVDPDRIVHIPNFLDRDKPDVNQLKDNRKYYLYFGRLSEEKGVLTLVKAMQGINSDLYIVGTGPIEKDILNYINDHKLDNFKLLGFKSGQELIDTVGNAKAVILPSEWYENGPYSAIEALQLGRPIIGADIGGIPELVGGNGYLFKSGDPASLHRVISEFETLSDTRRGEMELKSEELFKTHYTAPGHMEKLSLVYNKAIERHLPTARR